MRRAMLGAALLTALISTGHAQSKQNSQQDVVVSNAWARASAGMATTGAAYFTVTDNASADQLVGASTPIAGKAELHETRNENGVMQMRSVAALPLEPGKKVTLAPGGYHVMLMDLKHPLKPGESFPLTLTFEKAQPVTVNVKVGSVGAAAPMPGMSGSQPMMGSKP